MKSLLNEITQIKKTEKEFDTKLDEISKIFETLEKLHFNNPILRRMQITASVGKQSKLYSDESLDEMCKESEQLTTSEAPLKKLGQKICDLCKEIQEGKFNTLISTEFSSSPNYYAIKKLFLNFRNNYSLNSKLF